MLNRYYFRIIGPIAFGTVALATTVCCSSNLNDITRKLHKSLPIRIQNYIRDSGIFRQISDQLVTLSATVMCLFKPELLLKFYSISSSLKTFEYSKHKGCHLEVMKIENKSKSGGINNRNKVLVFVHGGAWGSGKTWHYRLIAHGLGEALNVGIVANVGYPVYPFAIIPEQANYVSDAMNFIRELFQDEYSIILCGHSSGANICALSILQNIQNSNNLKIPHTFIGLAGVYNIINHYEFEKNRGVHEISPMKAAAQGEAFFEYCSPSLITRKALVKSVSNIAYSFPRIVLLHGEDDTVVPLQSSEEFAIALEELTKKSVERIYLKNCDHTNPILDWMLPKPTQVTTAVVQAFNQ
eukprot:gene16998-23345_t